MLGNRPADNRHKSELEALIIRLAGRDVGCGRASHVRDVVGVGELGDDSGDCCAEAQPEDYGGRRGG